MTQPVGLLVTTIYGERRVRIKCAGHDILERGDVIAEGSSNDKVNGHEGKIC
jgi:hypothetical protein